MGIQLYARGEELYINYDTKSNINWGEKQEEINRILIMRANFTFIILVSPKNFLFTYHNPQVKDRENGASLNTAMNLVSLYISGSWSVTFGPVASISPQKLLEMQIIRPHVRFTKLETLGLRPSNLCFNNFYRWFRYITVKTTAPYHYTYLSPETLENEFREWLT